MANSYEEAAGREYKDPQVIQMEEIAAFSKENNFNSHELSAAYELAMGCMTKEILSKEHLRGEVFMLAKKMDEMMGDGLAVNKVTKFIETKKEFEFACENYYALVDRMLINDKGKRMLKSIVEDKRPGNLMVHLDGKSEGVKIPEEIARDEYPQNKLAEILTRYLNKYEGKKIDIVFSE